MFERSRQNKTKQLLLTLSKYGHFDLALELYADSQINNLSIMERFSIFVATCQCNRFDVAKHMYCCCEITFQHFHDITFRIACQHGHLPIC